MRIRFARVQFRLGHLIRSGIADQWRQRHKGVAIAPTPKKTAAPGGIPPIVVIEVGFHLTRYRMVLEEIGTPPPPGLFVNSTGTSFRIGSGFPIAEAWTRTLRPGSQVPVSTTSHLIFQLSSSKQEIFDRSNLAVACRHGKTFEHRYDEQHGESLLE